MTTDGTARHWSLNFLCLCRASMGLRGDSGAWLRYWKLISDSDVSKWDAAARASRRNFSRPWGI
ncbi:hypothetical protein DPMN_189452 [Dreissena polymorpha]|uniref:Uncharacterized protein n=1 Tax=Dreissena polymorpha TaxID=45954 RepID=A0A9D4DU51_DREPO|nr:hypothetical protein DPMN_189452 [Dreissena polymorpha]